MQAFPPKSSQYESSLSSSFAPLSLQQPDDVKVFDSDSEHQIETKEKYCIESELQRAEEELPEELKPIDENAEFHSGTETDNTPIQHDDSLYTLMYKRKQHLLHRLN